MGQIARERAIRSDGREIVDNLRFKTAQGAEDRVTPLIQQIRHFTVNQFNGSSAVDFILVLSFFGISLCILPKMQVEKL